MNRTAPTRQRPLSRPPRLVVVLKLEQPGHIVLDADTYEDELRLRQWLRRSTVLRNLPALLARLLDDLDDGDRIAA
jgi:hypothetical protein